MSDSWAVVILVPKDLSAAAKDALFTAVADAAHKWEPTNRDGWDVDVFAGPYDEAVSLRDKVAAVASAVEERNKALTELADARETLAACSKGQHWVTIVDDDDCAW